MEVKAKRVAGFDECNAPGEFFITSPNEVEGGDRRLSFRCPCGCGDLCGIRINDSGTQTPSTWGWDKNKDCPTCTPSIDINHGHWHGHLIAGVFKKA